MVNAKGPGEALRLDEMLRVGNAEIGIRECCASVLNAPGYR
jgi:hypothetical protein